MQTPPPAEKILEAWDNRNMNNFRVANSFVGVVNSSPEPIKPSNVCRTNISYSHIYTL